MKYTVTFDLEEPEEVGEADLEDAIFEALSNIGADNIQIRGD